jgi:hypothetical protein
MRRKILAPPPGLRLTRPHVERGGIADAQPGPAQPHDHRFDVVAVPNARAEMVLPANFRKPVTGGVNPREFDVAEGNAMSRPSGSDGRL